MPLKLAAQHTAVLLSAFAIAIVLLTLAGHQDWNTVHILWADSVAIIAVAAYLFRRSSQW